MSRLGAAVAAVLPLLLAASATESSAAIAPPEGELWKVAPMTAVVRVTEFMVNFRNVSQPNGLPRMCYRAHDLPLGWFARQGGCNFRDPDPSSSDDDGNGNGNGNDTDNDDDPISRKMYRARAPYVDDDRRYLYAVVRADRRSGGTAYAIEFTPEATCVIWQFRPSQGGDGDGGSGGGGELRCLELMVLARLAERSNLTHNATWPPLGSGTFGSLSHFLHDTDMVGGNRTLSEALSQLGAIGHRQRETDGWPLRTPETTVAVAADDADDAVAADDDDDDDFEYVDEDVVANGAVAIDPNDMVARRRTTTTTGAMEAPIDEDGGIGSRIGGGGGGRGSSPAWPTSAFGWVDVIRSTNDDPLPRPSSVVMPPAGGTSTSGGSSGGGEGGTTAATTPAPSGSGNGDEIPLLTASPMAIGMVGGASAVLLLLVPVAGLMYLRRRRRRRRQLRNNGSSVRRLPPPRPYGDDDDAADDDPEAVRRAEDPVYCETTIPIIGRPVAMPTFTWVFGGNAKLVPPATAAAAATAAVSSAVAESAASCASSSASAAADTNHRTPLLPTFPPVSVPISIPRPSNPAYVVDVDDDGSHFDDGSSCGGGYSDIGTVAAQVAAIARARTAPVYNEFPVYESLDKATAVIYDEVTRG